MSTWPFGTPVVDPGPAPGVEIIPLEEEARRADAWLALQARPPWVALGVIAACGAAYGLVLLAGGDGSALGRLGAKVVPRLERGEYWRLVTAGFLHASAFHLGANALAVYFAGRLGENLWSRRVFFTVLVVGGVVAQLFSWAGSRAQSVGLSGGAFALFGALISFQLRHRRHAPEADRGALAALVVWAAATIAGGALRDDIDNWAHLGGLWAGLAMGVTIAAPTETPRRRPLATLAAVLAAVALLAAVAFDARAALWPPAPVQVRAPAGFTVELPAGWRRHGLQGAAGVVASDDFGAAICVARAPLGEPEPEDEDLRAALVTCAGVDDPLMPPVAVDEHVSYRGRSWRRVLLGVKLPTPTMQRVYVTRAGGFVYFVVGECPASSLGHYRKVFDAVAGSFELP